MAGLFGTDWLTGDVLGAGLGLIGGLASGGNESSQSTKLDPRIAQYLYGEGGKSGTLADANSIYKQQIAQGGLNDLQRQGMGMQLQYLQSPQYTQGYQAMMNQGMGLLNSSIAGNPFSRGQQAPGGAGQQAGNFQFSPQTASVNPIVPQRPSSQPSPSSGPSFGQVGLASYNGGQGGRNSTGQPTERTGGSFGAAPGGQGNSNDMTSAALGLMGFGENPAARMLTPMPAMAARVVGGAMADRQIDARSLAAGQLAASQPMANLGIGTVSDVNGNVRTFSTPESIAAADRAMFGGTGSRNGNGYGNMGNGGYGGATGGYGGSYGSGSIGGFGRD
jgi:hypothetical protein